MQPPWKYKRAKLSVHLLNDCSIVAYILQKILDGNELTKRLSNEIYRFLVFDGRAPFIFFSSSPKSVLNISLTYIAVYRYVSAIAKFLW